ncbi:MAG: 30S ribosomal protein S18 [bacterium]
MSRDRDYDRDRDDDRGYKRRSFGRRKACRFCTDKEVKVDYKNPKLLSYFVSERGKIIPRRISGTCALHQRDLTTAVKQARVMALLPFTSTQR